MSRKIYGVGINDADYKVKPTVNGKRTVCPFYLTWINMLKRNYSKSYQEQHPTYKDCKVCPDWLTFSNFKAWMETQNWKDRQLDKDILGDGKLYSPETCCFVPQWLNKLFNKYEKGRGEYPLGVSINAGGYFVADLKVKGRSQYLGRFDSPEGAHEVYLKAKRQHIINMLENYPDSRIKQAVLKKFT